MDGSAATAQHDARAHKLSRCCSTQRARDLAETIPGTHPNLNRGQDTRANRTRYLDTFKLWGPRKARPVYCRVNTSPLLRDKRSGIARAPNSVLWGRKGVYSTDPSTVAGIRFVN